MIPDKIKEVIEGICCPKCGSERLYQLFDVRFKCANCYHRYTPEKIDDDFHILRFFSNERPAHLAAKIIECSYNKVYRRYMKFRQEILEYADKKNIPRRTTIEKVRKIPKDKELTGFRAFAKKRLYRYRRIREEHLPLYQRELEFRYHYRNKDIRSLLNEIHLNTLKQP